MMRADNTTKAATGRVTAMSRTRSSDTAPARGRAASALDDRFRVWLLLGINAQVLSIKSLLTHSIDFNVYRQSVK